MKIYDRYHQINMINRLIGKLNTKHLWLSSLLFTQLFSFPVQGQTKDAPYIKFDDTRPATWPKEFAVVGIPSSLDNVTQKAFFYKSTLEKPAPLIISLHTWSGDYTQSDGLANICKRRNVNYIHPDFRGANNNPSACCSEKALNDIDDAITFAVKYGNVDTNKIYVIGVSGGGYATLATFMKSKRTIQKFSAWASISNLEAWYHESVILKDKYAATILACTGSKDSIINVKDARSRSPLFMVTPTSKLKKASLSIHVGVYDGLQGSVPITHSINFYNKLLRDLNVKDSTKYVTEHEKLQLMEFRRPLGDYGKIADRKVCLKKSFGSLSLTVFVGNHEMLNEFALDELLN